MPRLMNLAGQFYLKEMVRLDIGYIYIMHFR